MKKLIINKIKEIKTYMMKILIKKNLINSKKKMSRNKNNKIIIQINMKINKFQIMILISEKLYKKKTFQFYLFYITFNMIFIFM